MRLLWIATKPPWPPVDGGRLVQWLTLEALAAEGVEVTLVAPVGDAEEAQAAAERLAAVLEPRLVVAPPPPAAWTLLVSRLLGLPFSVVRHRRRPVAREVAGLLASRSFDAVHVEQLQAWPQVPRRLVAAGADPAAGSGPPVVLRTQNVESDLWRATGELARGPRGLFARSEAARLARYEGRAVATAAAAVALTPEDAERLEGLAGRAASGRRSLEAARIEVVPAPFPASLPPADEPLPGDPALVLLGSSGWLPNRDSERWFLEAVWPRVAERCPGARLHVFGGAGSGRGASAPGTGERLVFHPAPRDSRDAFAPGSVLVVPLRIASGVRMKILEAWARGVPVVATPAAARGLGAEDGRELLLAADPESFVEAIGRLASPASVARAAAGRELLARHDPGRVAAELSELYRELIH